MVKGVSKTIIEVNNTGSRYFEKIVFYVTPQYGNLNAKQLKRAASSFSFNFDNSLNTSPLRKRHKQRKMFKILGFSVMGLVGLVTALVIIF